MRTMYFTVGKGPTGSWRSIGSAGRPMRPNDSIRPTNSLKRDAFTTSSDFIISPHPASTGLYVATCGSFHGWKFFPVLGKYVLQMLEGSLSPTLAAKWAWDRERPDPSLNADWPRTEMKDLLDPARTSML